MARDLSKEALPPEPEISHPSGMPNTRADVNPSGVNALPVSSPQRTPLPVLALPIGDQDILRAAFAWNLTVEMARLGARALLVSPELDEPSPLWPDLREKPLGAELIKVPHLNPQGVITQVNRLASTRNPAHQRGGIILLRIPPTWLRQPAEVRDCLRWTLLFSTARPDDLREAYALGKLVTQVCPQAQLGLTIHGVDRRDQAENSYQRVALAFQKHLHRELLSYGLLADDLLVYRTIVAHKPIGLCHPQSIAARAMRDVASTLLEDARKIAGD
ncbi:MAG: hypothetical protein CBC48_11370 [bacterium TMED88]|nr:hypothetical protein [Deltaproteobacteria bacterium]OUV29942.1 MAG: hypothetical protein CBC48_11370 [bacterium TMED88]